MKGEYYLGLDMGSGSVGWAVTNEKYEILRAHGKTLWGVRLFDSAQTAEERRGFRTAKRRLDRRNWRIELLKKIFAEEVEKIDDGFFRRMKESRYWPEDKRDRQGKCPELPYALFADDDYTDKEYHKQFPTIYHLRKWLMETDETPDIRLIYLALHHMMKHRGHFLLNGNIEQVREFQTTFEQFLEAVRAEELGFSSEIGVERSKEIEAILKDRTLTKSAKKTKAVKAMRAAVALLQENKKKFAVDHLEIIEGTAPEALEALPVPTHAFIGGSAGNLKEILELLLRKNPNIRVVLNTVTVETLAEAALCFKKLAFEEPEIVCLQASNAKKAGRSHLMIAQNPVYIFTAQGGAKE